MPRPMSHRQMFSRVTRQPEVLAPKAVKTFLLASFIVFQRGKRPCGPPDYVVPAAQLHFPLLWSHQIVVNFLDREKINDGGGVE
ncbi:hypothetical protein EVAR_49080_1 [Eumeta japonica]|uniref:Uncharacterized protein n=1 Tax=Eumeta variegata TaxID=151549 RepID=A0A4C1Z9K1_EUMVA|nr:hypothetical protein EVAR_49080_1 [Eumeta japonica]